MRNKVYPHELHIEVGDLFDRLPNNVAWVVQSGTLPMYGRAIIKSTKVNDNKYEIELGEVTGRYLAEPETVSLGAVILVYGEFAT